VSTGIPTFENKIIQEDVAHAVARLPHAVVFTSGCFDILHRGHVTYLAQSRALGASLVVGVNADNSVRRQNKGPGRPVNSLADRMAVLAALESVSLVVPFEEDTPLELILAIRPDILVKGGDRPADSIIGAAEVRRWGGQVLAIPFIHQRSTTEIIEKIRT
jgi:D-glycero-beta-D-manno-heptose 1-phosphate adenylyltransferase